MEADGRGTGEVGQEAAVTASWRASRRQRVVLEVREAWGEAHQVAYLLVMVA